MNNTAREKEFKQFKALTLPAIILYPFWLVYGLWSGNHDAPIIVGFIAAWAVWYIKYVKARAESSGGNEPLNWHDHSVEYQINIPVLIISLSTAVSTCLLLLVALNVFNK